LGKVGLFGRVWFAPLEAAGEIVSSGLILGSVAVTRAASSFFFLHREIPHKPTQSKNTKMIAVSMLGKNFLIPVIAVF
jgi:hypothetical protein